jgi:membrane-associated protease RseP (regulator of RpoE activity)
MLVVLGILIFAFGLLFSIAFHELGHLAAAKVFGIKVTQYMVGFGRTLFSRRRGDTEYGVKAIPLGGYIRMIGMFPPRKPGARTKGPFASMIEDAREAAAEEVGPGDEDKQFFQRSPWKRIIVMIAGPAMNLVLAAGIFAAVLMGYGIAQPTTTVSSVSQCVLPANVQDTGHCPPAAAPSPAAAAGFQPGDKIVEFGGRPYQNWAELQQAIRRSKGTVPVVVERRGQRVPLTVQLMQTPRPKLDDPGTMEQVGFLGLAPQQVLVRQSAGGVAATMGDYIGLTAQKIVQLPSRVPGLVDAIGGQQRSPDSPVGIVGASRLGGEVLAYDQVSVGSRLIVLANLLAGLNLSLFALNMLPILPLDGGHVAGALWESLRRWLAKVIRRPDPGPFDTAKLMPFAYGMMAIFIAYSLLVMVADIVNPVQLF